MIRSLIILALLLLSAPAFAADGNAISYTFDYRPGETPVIKVAMTFKGEDDGDTFVSLPDQWGGQEKLYEALSDFACLTEGCEISSAGVPSALRVTHKPGETLSVSYIVRQDWQGPLERGIYYRPIINGDYVHMIGQAVLAVPDNYKDQAASVSFSWQNLPAGWSAVTSFGEGASVDGEVNDIWDAVDGLYLAGDFDTKTVDIKGGQLKIAVRGDWAFSEEDFYGLAEKIVVAERTFWDDFSTPYFLISLIPMDEPCCSLGGTALYNTFAMFVSHDVGDLEQFKYLLAHEMMHNWTGRTIQPAEPEEYMYWFTEGFTDYYTGLLNLRAGIITLDDYAAGYNQVLEAYFFSSARNATRDDVKEKFWSDPAVEKLPYQQGNILAHNWNAMIKAQNRESSLDDVMRDLLEEAREGDSEFSADRLDDTFRQYITGGILGEAVAHVTGGETVYPRDGALGPCYGLTDVEKHAFALGFKTARTGQDNEIITIKEVDEDHNAYAAGLRPGQVLTGYSIQFGQSDQAVKLTVRDGDETKSIEYLPWGEAAFIPQYALDQDMYARDPDACMAWFLGD